MSDNATAAHAPASLRKAVAAGSVGNVVEWFDWTVYALFAPIFASQIFPKSDPTAALLSTLAVFGVGFLARPIGGIWLGRIADRHGRSRALGISITLMCLASLVIGLLPTAEVIGVWAAVILVAARLVQGISLGGELPAALTYLAHHSVLSIRARVTSAFSVSAVLGTLGGSFLGFVLAVIFTPDQMAAFGWRIPFLFGAVLGLVGFWVRRTAPETPLPSQEEVQRPVSQLGRLGIGRILATIATAVAFSFAFFGFIVSFPSIAIAAGAIDDDAYLANTIGLLVLLAVLAVFATLADRYGLLKVMLAGLAILAIVAIPLTAMMGRDASLLLVQVGLIIPFGIAWSPLYAMLTRLFPVGVSAFGIGVLWNIPAAVVGGFAPLIATWLSTSGYPTAFGIVIAALTAIAIVTILIGWRPPYAGDASAAEQPA